MNATWHWFYVRTKKIPKCSNQIDESEILMPSKQIIQVLSGDNERHMINSTPSYIIIMNYKESWKFEKVKLKVW